MATQIWVNIGSDNALLPDGDKPLSEPILIYITCVLWHSPNSNFTRSAHEHSFEITTNSRRGQRVKCTVLVQYYDMTAWIFGAKL